MDKKTRSVPTCTTPHTHCNNDSTWRLLPFRQVTA